MSARDHAERKAWAMLKVEGAAAKQRSGEVGRNVPGRLTDHQRTMLGLQLDHVRYLDQQITTLDAEVATRLAPFEAQITQLDTIPGVSQRMAEVIVAGRAPA